MMGQQRVNRFPPALGPENMKTYQVTHQQEGPTRPRNCAESDCVHYADGWQTQVDESTDLGKRQGWYIRNQSGRKYTEDRLAEITIFQFSAGQRCFADHGVTTFGPTLFLVRGGDWRGNPARIPTVRHTKPEHWVEDFSEHQQHIAAVRERG